MSWTRIVSPAVVNEVNSGFRGLKELGNAKTADEFKNFCRIAPVSQRLKTLSPLPLWRQNTRRIIELKFTGRVVVGVASGHSGVYFRPPRFELPDHFIHLPRHAS